MLNLVCLNWYKESETDENVTWKQAWPSQIPLCSLYNETFSSSDYIALNESMIHG
jgi:hypothetical protein